MWENVVGPALEDINPKLNPKTDLEVDELLATEIGMYVCPPQFSLSVCIICIICIMSIICTYAINADGLCQQAKKGRQNQVRQAAGQRHPHSSRPLVLESSFLQRKAIPGGSRRLA